MRVLEMYDFPDGLPSIDFPLFLSTVRAGFPSPADDHIDLRLDLNELLVKNRSSTFFVRVSGDSMIEAGIQEGDMLTVDRSLTPHEGKIIVAVINGECTVKRIHYRNNQLHLMPANPRYLPIIIDEFNHSFEVWGVVTSIIRKI